MPLTLISDPNSLPTVQNDYVAQNNLIETMHLDPYKKFHIDFENDVIPEGSIIYLGGSVLKAESDESIGGIKSDYVVIDHTSRTASYAASLSGVTWDDAYNGYYDAAGDLYIFDEATAYFNGDITTPHMLYSQIRRQVFEELGVSKPNWTIATLRGSALSISNADAPALAALNSTDVAYYDGYNTELRTYRFNGSTWALVGIGIDISPIGTPAVSALDSTDIAFIDATNDELRQYHFLNEPKVF
jgi:hypothetical protein